MMLATDYNGTEIHWNGENTFTVYYRGMVVDTFSSEGPVSMAHATALCNRYMCHV